MDDGANQCLEGLWVAGGEPQAFTSLIVSSVTLAKEGQVEGSAVNKGRFYPTFALGPMGAGACVLSEDFA